METLKKKTFKEWVKASVDGWIARFVLSAFMVLSLLAVESYHFQHPVHFSWFTGIVFVFAYAILVLAENRVFDEQEEDDD